MFYTDGLVEARDATGKFFPLTESASIQDRPDPETLLEQLSAEVSRHASHQRHDDQALVLIWRQDSDAASRRCPQPAGDQRQA